MAEEQEWDSLTVRVRRIANGFLVTESKSSGWREADSTPLFYPTMEGVKAELVIRLGAASALELTEKEDF